MLSVCVLLVVAQECLGGHPELVLAQGRLRGLLEESLSGRTIYAFRGIPYARPPIDELRFAVSFFIGFVLTWASK